METETNQPIAMADEDVKDCGCWIWGCPDSCTCDECHG